VCRHCALFPEIKFAAALVKAPAGSHWIGAGILRAPMIMKRRISLGLLAIASATIACSIFVGGPALPDPPVAAPPDAFQALQSEIETAVFNSLTDGALRLSITQEQLTAFLVSRLSRQAEPLITDPQVVLRNGEMIIYGRARSWIFEANMAVTAVFSIDEDGRPEILISHAELGPLPMPTALRDAIAVALNEALTGAVGPVALGFRLETIDIADGSMTLTGRLR
jgi:hypothetical protein